LRGREQKKRPPSPIAASTAEENAFLSRNDRIEGEGNGKRKTKLEERNLSGKKGHRDKGVKGAAKKGKKKSKVEVQTRRGGKSSSTMTILSKMGKASRGFALGGITRRKKNGGGRGGLLG